MSERALFLDTMIFLHFQPIDQIPWVEIFGAERVRLILARSVISELDEKKDTGSSRVRDRARKALQAIHQGTKGAELRPGVTLEFRASRPRIDFDEYGLDPTRRDDQLIASILDYSVEYPAADVLLVSHDYGPILKGEHLGLRVSQLPREYGLHEEQDPQEVELREAHARLAKFEHAMPQLDINFSDGEKHKHAVAPPWSLPSDEWVANQMEHVRAAHPKYPTELKQEPGSAFPVPQNLVGLMVYGLDEIERYNGELDAFFASYEAYLREHESQLIARNRSLELDLVLVNNGTLPAEDIDLFFYFPDGFSVLSEAPSIHEPPSPPSKPKTGFERMISSIQMPFVHPFDYFSQELLRVQGNTSQPKIRRTNSYEVEMNVRYLKHGFVQNLQTIWIAFGPEDTPSPFTVEYKVIAANVPGVLDGQLHVVVRVDE